MRDTRYESKWGGREEGGGGREGGREMRQSEAKDGGRYGDGGGARVAVARVSR